VREGSYGKAIGTEVTVEQQQVVAQRTYFKMKINLNPVTATSNMVQRDLSLFTHMLNLLMPSNSRQRAPLLLNLRQSNP
jgi:hypothetical protein